MEKYRPSNGSEGDWFINEYCMNCIHENPSQESKHKCDILTFTFCLDLNDKDYPSEWTYNEKHEPICTAFSKWDWNIDGDPNDPDNPKAPKPDDPNQLCFPFIIAEIEQSIKYHSQNPELIKWS